MPNMPIRDISGKCKDAADVSEIFQKNNQDLVGCEFSLIECDFAIQIQITYSCNHSRIEMPIMSHYNKHFY